MAPGADGHRPASTCGHASRVVEESNTLRIAIVSSEVSWCAGVPHYFAALARTLSDDNDVHIFASRVDRTGLGRVTVHKIPTIPWGWTLHNATFYAVAPFVIRLKTLLSRRGFDVVLGPGMLAPYADVATFHFDQQRELDLIENGAFPDDRPGLGGLRALDYDLYSRFMRWLDRHHLRSSDSAFVAISQGVKDDLMTRYGLDSDSIAVVPNGVDCDRFHPDNRQKYRTETRAELGLRADEAAILFVGHSWGRKGLAAALDALDALGPYSASLLVAGAGTPEVFLRGRPQDLRKRVKFIGERSRDIERYYAAADIFLLPTLYEPFGLVITEALASGLPTVVSASAGAAELLRDGVDALLLRDPADPLEIVEKVRLIIDAPEVASRLATNGRRTAERLAWDRIGQRLLAQCAA